MKSILTCCLFFCACYLLPAQNYSVREFTNNNGLISAENYDTYQDSSGFYWLTCFGGLVRFDGTFFKSFRNSDGLTDFDVTEIFEETKNNCWICNGFSSCDSTARHSED